MDDYFKFLLLIIIGFYLYYCVETERKKYEKCETKNIKKKYPVIVPKTYSNKENDIDIQSYISDISSINSKGTENSVNKDEESLIATDE